MIPAFVTGVGVWAPGFRDAAAWLRGAPDLALRTAPAELLPAALRRRCSALSRMVAEAAVEAASGSAAELSRASIVLGSAFGELTAAVEMIRSFREGEGIPSPTRFHNSVHNTPVAYLSIATENRGMATAIAAGDETPAMGLLEALTVLEERGGAVLLALADEAVPQPLAARRAYESGAVALLLSAEARPAARARLSGLRRGSAAPAELPAAFAAHPCAGGFALVSAVSSGRRGTVPLGPGADGWIVDLEPVGAA